MTLAVGRHPRTIVAVIVAWIVCVPIAILLYALIAERALEGYAYWLTIALLVATIALIAWLTVRAFRKLEHAERRVGDRREAQRRKA